MPNHPIEFSEGRRSAEVALHELQTATHIPEDQILAQIPELNRHDLAFGISWADVSFDQSPIGRHNALVATGKIELRIPELTVEGDKRNDLSGINRSYRININNGTFQGFHDFDGAFRDPEYITQIVAFKSRL